MKEVEIGGKKVKVASTVDAIGLYCPMPVVKLKLELERLKLNQVVELFGDAPGMVEDTFPFLPPISTSFISN